MRVQVYNFYTQNLPGLGLAVCFSPLSPLQKTFSIPELGTIAMTACLLCCLQMQHLAPRPHPPLKKKQTLGLGNLLTFMCG